MKELVIALLLSVGVIFSSCTKSNPTVEPEAATSIDNNQGVQPSTTSTNHGWHTLSEDEDRRIRIKTQKGDRSPISGSLITMVHSTDTVHGTTDEAGEHLFTISAGMVWAITISHPNYITVNSSIAADTSTEKIYYLEPK